MKVLHRLVQVFSASLSCAVMPSTWLQTLLFNTATAHDASEMERSRPIVFLMTLLLACLLVPAECAADAAWEFCVSVNPDNRIAACTQVLARSATLSAHDRAMAYAYRGDAHATKANHDRAIQDCNEAILLDPKYAYAYTVRGTSYANQANFDRAIQDYNEAIRLDPKYAHAYTVRGIAYANKANYDRAIQDYNRRYTGISPLLSLTNHPRK